MAAAAAAFGLVGKTNIVIRQAADTGTYPACLYLPVANILKDFFFQILARL